MEAAAYYNKVRESIRGRGWGEMPRWEDLDASLTDTLAPIMDRLVLVQSLERGSVAGRGKEKAGPEKSALQAYLLLTCLDMLGRGGHQGEDVDFPAWMATRMGAHQQEGGAGELASGQSSGGIKPASSEGAKPPAEKDKNQKIDLEDIGAAYGEFQSLHGLQSNFVQLFTRLIDLEVRQHLADDCWVYKDDPIEDWDVLYLVRRGYKEDRTPEHARLYNARKRWDSLTSEQRVREIAEVCASMYHQYALGAVPAPSKNSQDPLPKIKRDIGQAAADSRLNFLSDSYFRVLATASGHQTLDVEGVEGIIKDGELYVRLSDFHDRDTESWKNKLLDWSRKRTSTGEAIMLYNMNCALVLSGKLFVDHLQDWINNALKNYISGK